jgi:hypothetical protein
VFCCMYVSGYSVLSPAAFCCMVGVEQLGSAHPLSHPTPHACSAVAYSSVLHFNHQCFTVLFVPGFAAVGCHTCRA